MNLKVPQKDPQQLILYLWKIIDLLKIPKKDLLYNISFKFFLISPSKAEKLIQNSIKRGYLIKNQDNTISLSDNLEKQLKLWQKRRKNKVLKRQKIREKRASDLNKYRKSRYSDFGTILKAFLDKGTINRAVTVSDDSFNIITLNLEEGEVKAEVLGSKEEPYIIEIDMGDKVLRHNCHDFKERRAANKKFCKHLAKFFLMIKEQNEDLTVELLNRIADSINEWKFTS